MPRIKVQLSGSDEGARVEVGDDDAVILGRFPEAARLSPALPELAGRALRSETLASPSVSANHALVWSEEGTIGMRDLGSKNGSWVRIPRGEAIRVPAGDDLELRLGGLGVTAAAGNDPASARWKTREDFPWAIHGAVERWLRALGVPFKVRIGEGQAGGSEDQIPLANGGFLQIDSDGTADARSQDVLERLWTFVARENARFETEEAARNEGMILASDAMRDIHHRVVEAAHDGLRLLLLGPSGSGKEELARCYHRHAGRSGPFVALNCSMFNRELLRSELFGAEAGAYTDSKRRIVGAVERAHGGTLFLDEIGDMALDLQPMLLRFLDHAEFERLGQYGNSRRVDIRLVCATNRDLRAASRRGEFRADLWFRISGRVVEIPGLEERPEDVLAYLQSRRSPSGVTIRDALGPEAIAAVLSHRWTGNFRELSNFADGLPRTARRGEIDAATCRRILKEVSLMPERTAAPPRAPGPDASTASLSALAAQAAAAFAADYDKALPSTWDEVKDFIEKYYKPVLFAQLSGAAADPDGGIDVQRYARALDADRGTAGKQLARWSERFRG